MTPEQQRDMLLEAAIKVRDALDRGDHPGALASILDSAIAAAQAAEWRDKAERGEHPGRGFCLEQARRWERHAAATR